MKQTSRWNRALAWLCAAVMVVMMLPMSGFTTVEADEDSLQLSDSYLPDEEPLLSLDGESGGDGDTGSGTGGTGSEQNPSEGKQQENDGQQDTSEVTVTFDGTNVNWYQSGTSITSIQHSMNEKLSVTLTAAANYTLDQSGITITVGETTLDSTGYTYTDGTIEIEAAKLTGDVEIKASATENYYYEVSAANTNENKNIKFSVEETKVYAGENVTLTLTPAAYCTLPETVTVSVNGKQDNTAVYAKGRVTLKLAGGDVGESGPIVVTGKATATEYDVKIKLDSETVKKLDTVKCNENKLTKEDDGSYGFKATAFESYSLIFKMVQASWWQTKPQMPSIIYVGETAVSASNDEGAKYTITKGTRTAAATGTLTIAKGEITEATKISNTAPQSDTVDISFKTHGLKNAPSEATAAVSQNYEVEFAAAEGYTLPDGITVVRKGEEKDETLTTNDYTWKDGKLTISKEKLTADFEITVEATLNANNYVVAPETADGSNGWYKNPVTIKPKSPAMAIQVDESWYKGIIIGRTAEDKDDYYKIEDCQNESVIFKVGDGTWDGDDYTESKESEGTTLSFSVDTTLPEVAVAAPEGTNPYDGVYYTNDSAEVSFTVTDANFAPSVANGNKTTPKSNFAITCAADYTFAWVDNVCTVTLTASGNNDGRYTVELSVQDIAGNENTTDDEAPTNVSKPIFLDKTAPDVKVGTPSGNAVKEGEVTKYYTNDKSTVSFTVTDTNFVPSVASGNQGAEKSNFAITCGTDYTFEWKENVCTVTLTATGSNDGEYTVKLDVTDRAGNKGDDTSATIVLDKTSPVVTAATPEGTNPYNDIYYTNNSAAVRFTVKDTNFNPADNETYAVTTEADCAESAWTQSADGWTMTVTLTWDEQKTDGEYSVTLDVTDRAGNTGSTVSKKIVIDKARPSIAVAYTQSHNMENWLKETLWKIFGKNNAENGTITGTVTITDATSPIDVAGIKVEGLPTYDIPAQSTSKTVTITFTIPKDRMDQVGVTAKDMATNEETLTFNNENTNNTNYILDTVAPVVTFNDPDYTTVHSSNYTLSLTVTDPEQDGVYSGLNTVTYEICKYNTLSDANSQNDSYSVLDSGALYAKEGAAYDPKCDSKVVLGADYNSNLIFVRIIAKDNAGNQCVESRTDCFKMDNTAPAISVVYDNNDAQNSKYFKADRTATVTVVDDNFSSDLVEITTGGSALSWTAGTDAVKSDGVVDTYTCQISYASDNDYTLSIATRDLGGNSTSDSGVSYSGTATQDFTLDKTNPTYSIEFQSENETVENNGYGRADTTVSLSVNEHNFDATSATSGLTVTKDGVDISASVRSGLSWSSSGDTRAASFVLTEDGDYAVTMSFVDMAGNNSTDAGEFKVHVDQHDPVVKITGVANKSANNAKKIAPAITISDKYYNEQGVSIVLTNGKGEQVVVYDSAKGKLTGDWLTAEGISQLVRDNELDISSQTFTFENIDTDDIYSLVVTMTDLSGRVNTVMTVLNDKNKEEELSLEKNGRMRFSVNRNGSTYTVDDETMAALGQYVQSIGDVHIMEVNVDDLDPESIHITLTHDNVSRDLENGKDYSYQQPPEQNESGWNVYEYILNASLFEEDGVYTITVYSVDAAGNVSQNNTKEKNFEITFIVDKTAPIFVAMNLEAGEIYNEETRLVTLNCSDNIALDTVRVFWLDGTAEKDENGNYIWYETDAAGNVTWLAEELPVTQDGENYRFELKEGTSAATSRQSVLVVCTDKAGNQNEQQEILDFTISSSVWIRYFANKPLFYGSIGGVVALLVVAGFIILRNRDDKSKKKSASYIH